MSLLAVIKRYTERQERFYRSKLLPQEDRPFGVWASREAYRWFRASNVVVFEHYRRPGDTSEDAPNAPDGRAAGAVRNL
jgi:hypothetical protein